MSSDLTFEIFAYEMFRQLLRDKKGVYRCHVKEAYKDECLAYPELAEASNCVNLYYAICFRGWLFESLYLIEIERQVNEFKNSQLDFYYYVLRTCNRVDLFGNLTIFERVFATIVFVWFLCSYCCENNIIEVLERGHIYWAMYFEEFSEEFYKQGGWTRLKIVAVPYKRLYDFFTILNEEEITFIKMRKSIQNYYRFKKCGEIDHDESISISWIKFYIHFIDVSDSNELKNNWEREDFLKQLKYLCDPNGSEVFKALLRIKLDNSLETSMTNLIIRDKYQNFPSEGASLAQELDQKKAFTIEADNIKTEYLLSKSQEQDVKTTTVENLFESMTILTCDAMKGLKKTSIQVAQLLSTEKNTEKDDNDIKYATSKEHDEWKVKNGANGSTSLIGQIPPAKKISEKANNCKTQNGASKEQREWEDTKTISIPTGGKNSGRKNNEIKCGKWQKNKNKRKETEKKNNTIPIEETPCKGNTTDEESRKTRISIQEKQEDSNIKNFLRMLLVLGDEPGISYVKKTSYFHNK